MRLIKVHPLRENFLLCVECGKWHSTRDLYADTDGEPFKAYYCEACIKAKGYTQFIDHSRHLVTGGTLR